MVKHIILWQIKDELTEDEKAVLKAEAKDGLEALVGRIPGLVELHVYTDALASSNADMMLDATLTDEESLKGYAVHPEHVAIAGGKIAPNVKTRVCMDFIS